MVSLFLSLLTQLLGVAAKANGVCVRWVGGEECLAGQIGVCVWAGAGRVGRLHIRPGRAAHRTHRG